MHCITAHVGFSLLSLQCGFGYLGLGCILDLHGCVIWKRELKEENRIEGGYDFGNEMKGVRVRK